MRRILTSSHRSVRALGAKAPAPDTSPAIRRRTRARPGANVAAKWGMYRRTEAATCVGREVVDGPMYRGDAAMLTRRRCLEGGAENNCYGKHKFCLAQHRISPARAFPRACLNQSSDRMNCTAPLARNCFDLRIFCVKSLRGAVTRKPLSRFHEALRQWIVRTAVEPAARRSRSNHSCGERRCRAAGKVLPKTSAAPRRPPGDCPQ